MKVLIDIPKEIFVDYDADKFHDCFMRFYADCQNLDGLVGNYELETLECLDEAFSESKVVDNNTMYNNMLTLEWNELYWDEYETFYIDENGDEIIDYILSKCMDKHPKTDELVAVLTEDNKIDYVVYDGYDFGDYDRDDIDAWAELPKKYEV